MNILIAPDSFKESLSAKEVCENIEKGIRKVSKDMLIEKVPMADGGEGTVQSLVDATNGKIIKINATGPLYKSVESFYGILGDEKTAIIEMAAASGLPLISENERNPLKSTSYGTGELIKDALNRGCKKIILGLGGSATNDGGVGMARALGIRFLDKRGKEIGFEVKDLMSLYKIDLSKLNKKLRKCKIVAACDVSNPLCGEKGASYVFGPQKGADKKMVSLLDENLRHYGEIIKKQLNVDVIDYKGAGAAGGMGAAVIAFFNGKIKRGIDIVIEEVNLEEKVRKCDLVITGEGSIDYQTAYGKTPYGVAKLAKKYNKSVIAIAGSIGKNIEQLYDKGFDSIFSIVDRPMTLREAIRNSDLLIQNTSERIIRFLLSMK